MLTHVDIFSGIGGFALAAQWAGFRTVAFCEIDPFCQEVFAARFGAVADTKGERLEGRRDGGKGVNAEAVRLFLAGSNQRPLLIPDIRTLDGSRFRGATLLTGGFPCQPFSVAGKRKGRADDRHLWPEMCRVISEARPAWVVGENVAGIVNMELEQVCLDLEAIGYEVQPLVIPACAVNAPHRRDRVWIIARDGRDAGELGLPGIDGRGPGQKPSDGHSDAPDAEAPERNGGMGRVSGREGFTDDHEPSPDDPRGRGGRARIGTRPSHEAWNIPWPKVATSLCRVDDGLPTWIHRRRTERLKALGNSIVPQVAYEIIKTIAEIEGGYQ